MNTRFKILFVTDILNEYYTGGSKCFDFKIIPSVETIEILKNGQMMYRVIGNQLLVIVKVYASGTDQDKPVVPIDSKTKFVFYLDLSRPDFMSVTNVDFDLLPTKRFYFSNINQNEQTDIFYMSKPIADHASVDYLPGMLAKDSVTGNVHECLQKTPDSGAVHHGLGDLTFWKSRGKFQYATSSDLVPIINKINNFNIPAAATYSVTAFRLNTVTNNSYDIEQQLKKNKAVCIYDTDDPAIKNIQVDLSELLPGRYKIRINATDFDVYIDDFAAGYFGIVEVFNHLPATNKFALLDIDGKVKDRVVAGQPPLLNYIIRFANRFAFRKFVSTRKGVDSITADGGEYTFNTVPVPPPPLPTISSDVFISDKPVPMFDQQNIFKLVLKIPITSDPIKAPNPNPHLPGMLTRFGTDFYCTIYLNH